MGNSQSSQSTINEKPLTLLYVRGSKPLLFYK